MVVKLVYLCVQVTDSHASLIVQLAVYHFLIVKSEFLPHGVM